LGRDEKEAQQTMHKLGNANLFRGLEKRSLAYQCLFLGASVTSVMACI
jgi:hypothetical protein